MRAIAVVMVLAAGGCLGDLVPLHQKSQNTQAADGGAPVDLAQAPDPNPNPNPGPNPDLAAAPSADLAPSPQSACVNKTTPLTDGHHNPGLNCMNCHNNANPAISQFTVAGTLYDAVTGGAAVAGATVEITDAAGKVLTIISSANGNFYSEQALTFPVHARATACPADLHMVATAAVGACNSCHTAANQVHVP
jgi:hypothetical protein